MRVIALELLVLKQIQIQNYKSIEKIKISLGRVNVFIGENGAGKSNILEAIALAGAAQAKKLDNEFLASRGIRVSGPKLMRSAFNSLSANEEIKIIAEADNGAVLTYQLYNDNKPYSTWKNMAGVEGDGNFIMFVEWLKGYISSIEDIEEKKKFVGELGTKINDLLAGKGEKTAS